METSSLAAPVLPPTPNKTTLTRGYSNLNSPAAGSMNTGMTMASSSSSGSSSSSNGSSKNDSKNNFPMPVQLPPIHRVESYTASLHQHDEVHVPVHLHTSAQAQSTPSFQYIMHHSNSNSTGNLHHPYRCFGEPESPATFARSPAQVPKHSQSRTSTASTSTSTTSRLSSYVPPLPLCAAVSDASPGPFNSPVKRINSSKKAARRQSMPMPIQHIMRSSLPSPAIREKSDRRRQAEANLRNQFQQFHHLLPTNATGIHINDDALEEQDDINDDDNGIGGVICVNGNGNVDDSLIIMGVNFTQELESLSGITNTSDAAITDATKNTATVQPDVDTIPLHQQIASQTSKDLSPSGVDDRLKNAPSSLDTKSSPLSPNADDESVCSLASFQNDDPDDSSIASLSDVFLASSKLRPIKSPHRRRTSHASNNNQIPSMISPSMSTSSKSKYNKKRTSACSSRKLTSPSGSARGSRRSSTKSRSCLPPPPPLVGIHDVPTSLGVSSSHEQIATIASLSPNSSRRKNRETSSKKIRPATDVAAAAAVEDNCTSSHHRRGSRRKERKSTSHARQQRRSSLATTRMETMGGQDDGAHRNNEAQLRTSRRSSMSNARVASCSTINSTLEFNTSYASPKRPPVDTAVFDAILQGNTKHLDKEELLGSSMTSFVSPSRGELCSPYSRRMSNELEARLLKRESKSIRKARTTPITNLADVPLGSASDHQKMSSRKYTNKQQSPKRAGRRKSQSAHPRTASMDLWSELDGCYSKTKTSNAAAFDDIGELFDCIVEARTKEVLLQGNGSSSVVNNNNNSGKGDIVPVY